MAVNKNFVVKNGLEVSTDLILANADTTKVGIATTSPEYTLHVNGGIGATDSYVSGISTVMNEFNVGTGGTVLTALATPGIGYSIGIGTASPAYLLEIKAATGTTALYVDGDARITGESVLDNPNITNLTVSQAVNLNTVTGMTTISGRVDINNSVDIEHGLLVGGATTLGSSGGITTTGGDLYVDGKLTSTDANITGIATITTVDINGGDIEVSNLRVTTGIATIATVDINGGNIDVANLNVTTGIATIATVDINGGDIEVTNVDTSHLYVSGISTLGTVQISSGIVTALSGIVTYYGDGRYLDNIIAGVGIKTDGATAGFGITYIHFTGSGVEKAEYEESVGIATVTITAGTGGGGGGGGDNIITVLSRTGFGITISAPSGTLTVYGRTTNTSISI